MEKKINYFIPPTHPSFEDWMRVYKPVFEIYTANRTKTINYKVDPAVIESVQTLRMNEVIMMAEHKKEWIESIIFGINFEIKQISGSDLYYGIEDFLTNAKIARWLRRLGETFPITCFFLSQWEGRLGSIAGDIFIKKEPDIVNESGNGGFMTTAEEEKEIQERVWQASKLFMHYCYGTGYEPKQAIEAVLAEFNAVFEYEKVAEVFKKEIKNGFYYRVKVSGKPTEE
jgi:hypothetical protein